MNKTASEAVRFVQELASALPKDPAVGDVVRLIHESMHPAA